jgi:RNA polymerase sigma-70 factor (ECF subfamily)
MLDRPDQGEESERLRQRDPAAWESFYERVYPMMLAYAERRLGRGENARDAVAEALARTVSSVARMADLDASPDAWGFGILRNVVTDAQRHMYRDRKVPAADETHSPDPLEALVGAGEYESVRQAFSQLHHVDREILELRVVAQLSSEEVGHVLSMNPGAVRMAQARALERLRALMLESSVHG